MRKIKNQFADEAHKNTYRAIIQSAVTITLDELFDKMDHRGSTVTRADMTAVWESLQYSIMNLVEQIIRNTASELLFIVPAGCILVEIGIHGLAIFTNIIPGVWVYDWMKEKRSEKLNLNNLVETK